MNTSLRILPVVALAVVLAACGGAAGGSPSPSPSPAGLAGRTFLSTAVTVDGAVRDLVAGTRIRITFGTDGQLGVDAGCNTFGATYRLDGQRLIVTGGAMTEMGCDQARMAQDTWVFALLGDGPGFTLTGNDLTLTNAGTVVTLLDREVADPDRPLAGTAWNLDGIIGGGAVSSVPLGITAGLTFHDDGTVDVASGCNTGSGRFEVDGQVLRIHDLVLTKRACAGPEAGVEGAVLAVLEAGQVAFAIDAGSLTITAGANGLTFRAP